MRNVGFLGGAAFASFIINPNYVSARSPYQKKFNLVFFGVFGFLLVNKYYEDKERRVNLRLQYHLPGEARRAVQESDWRYFALMDLEKAGELYNPESNRPY